MNERVLKLYHKKGRVSLLKLIRLNFSGGSRMTEELIYSIHYDNMLQLPVTMPL